MSQEKDNKDPKLSVSGTVAAGTIIVAVLGLITAFFNQGSLELLKGMGNAVAQQPSSSISSNPSPNTPSSNSSVQVNVDDFVVKLQGCKRTNETVKCEFFITNNKEDRGLQLYNNLSRIVDLQGNEYRPSYLEFGSKNSRTEGGSITQNLVQGVGLKAIITVENVPAQVNKLALIEIMSWTSRSGYLSFKLRDISVSN